MIPEQLRTGERELRNAISRRQYRDLPMRVGKLRSLADAHLAGLSANHPLRAEIAGWMLATIEWARLMVITQRQAWFNELERLPRVGRYLDRTANVDRSAPAPRVCLDL